MTQQFLQKESFPPAALSEKSIIKQAVTFYVKRAHKRLTAQQQLCACVHVT